MVPAVVLDPLPSGLRRLAGLLAGGGGTGSALVLQLLGGDEDQGLVEIPVAFPVLAGEGSGSGRSGGGGVGGSGDEERLVGVGVV